MAWLAFVAVCLVVVVLCGLLWRAYKDRDRWKDECQRVAFEAHRQAVRADRWRQKAENMDRGVGL